MHTTMKTFENLQDIWNQQKDLSTNKTASELIKKSEEHIKKIKLNHIGTLIIIGITTSILLYYFIWLGVYSVSIFTIGLGLMISSMLFRTSLEWISIKKFNALKSELPLLEYSKQAALFYKWRKSIHFVATPIVYLIYTIGLSLMIPTFQEQFSKPFFIYILISGYGFLIVFAFFLNKKLKNEMKILAFLKNIE